MFKHACSCNSQFSLWKKKRQEDPWLKDKCKDPVVLDLLDKLWKLTGYAKLNPSINTPPQRLRKMCVVYTQLKIAERHNLEPFLNDEGITLTSEDIEIIAEVARHVWATKYNRHSPIESTSRIRFPNPSYACAVRLSRRTTGSRNPSSSHHRPRRCCFSHAHRADGPATSSA